MAKRWKIEDDIFLVGFEDIGPNYVANHDLGFHGKTAGDDRIKKLKDLGIYDKIKAYELAKNSMNDAWVMAFGPGWAKDLVSERMEDEDLSIAKGMYMGKTASSGAINFLVEIVRRIDGVITLEGRSFKSDGSLSNVIYSSFP